MGFIHNHSEYWDDEQHMAATIPTESQQKILAVLPHITGALSVLGSCFILHNIWKDRGRKMRQPYYRILLGMSLFDALSSFSVRLSTVPMPVGTPNVVGARGTIQTCTAAGFFNQFMLGSILYNLVLAIYYTCSGQYKMPDKEFARRYEPHLHWATVVITVGVALAGLPLTLYNPAQLWCWLAPYPSNCETAWGEHNPDLKCQRGNNAWMYRWIFFYGPLWATIICVTILMGMLTWSVMQEEKDLIVMRNLSNDRTNMAEEQDRFESMDGDSNQSDENNHNGIAGDNRNSDESNNEHHNGRHHSHENNSSVNIQRPQLHKAESMQLERTRKMFYQAILYVGVFYLTWTTPTIMRLMQLVNCHVPFSILALAAALAPMQGFWNWLVYRHGPVFA